MKFLNQKYTRDSLKLALPVMITQLGQVSVNLFDNMIVGKLLGAQALASVSLGNATFFSFFVFAMGFSYAIPPLVSEAHSRMDHDKINSVFRHGFVINLAVGTLMMLLILFGMPLLYHMDQPKEIIPDTIHFLTIMAFSMIPFMVFQTFREVSEGLSFTIGVTKATIIANILNIVLNYILIEGKLGLPAMGVRGSALATLIARIFMVVFLYIVLYRDPRTSHYIKAFHLKINGFSKKIFSTMLKLGFPTALQLFFEVSAFAGAAFVCGLVSSTDIAAHQIALSMASFTFNLCVGFSVASTVMVGRKLGERDFRGLRDVGVNNIKLAFIFMIVCGLAFIIGRNILPHFFVQNNDVNVMLLASKLLIIAALFQLSDGIQVTCLGCLRGIQDVKIPSILTFIAYWVITIPLGYFLCYTLKMGALGMWIALGLGLTISAVLLVYRFLKLTNRKLLTTT
ncbi:MATE family efflux transporter [Elizabethkingia meningoseptica]|uniref:Multidrug-efflux transporter n=1 Tax=Elizabethkingia meningoseptica TaxID=238 RepID=A0A1V3TZH4_ELIME|nr:MULTISPECIES: MATE family efflux transporter [Elizabethkingia]AQX05666.1 MATE family efflux transporter [Elizabethkingia meningoseptica]AQX13214.1 MATE family efflux transporter [Elizabethkingia meningoseptica]AQX47709.1 MATE family efflux transporter [Elizabethkingia meningoseptica]EOR30666.1 NorM-like multidrug efflux protein [Elizabethkingia meningoseptica ATCC 13253 = NBRC 12535]KUY24028.1 MATE family efflux transporter [Elizabethkingia meningoseptica]